ncbi:MAG: hypothetical protein AMXMBFR58_20150 [Phycisphaerae bacterium]|nr:hypothetical protein [Phycisphaerales bacterium]
MTPDGASQGADGGDGRSPVPDNVLLRQFLATRSAECPVCGYDLKALPTDRCPECSSSLRLGVYSDNLRMGPWFLAVVSWTLALGFDGVVLAILLTVLAFIERPQSPGDIRTVAFMISSFGGLAIASAVGLWWVYTRRKTRWLRWPVRTQWTVAVCMFVGVGLGHALYGGFLMSRV